LDNHAHRPVMIPTIVFWRNTSYRTKNQFPLLDDLK
jgi:hypothetical protein